MTTIQDLNSAKNEIKTKLGYNIIPENKNIQEEIDELRNLIENRELIEEIPFKKIEENTVYFAKILNPHNELVYEFTKGQVIGDYMEMNVSKVYSYDGTELSSDNLPSRTPLILNDIACVNIQNGCILFYEDDYGDGNITSSMLGVSIFSTFPDEPQVTTQQEPEE